MSAVRAVRAGDIGKEEEETWILEDPLEAKPGKEIPAEPAVPLPREPVPA